MSAPMKQSLSEAERAHYAAVFDRWVEEVRETHDLHVWEPEPPIEQVVRRYEDSHD